jgi:hypothetical protein
MPLPIIFSTYDFFFGNLVDEGQVKKWGESGERRYVYQELFQTSLPHLTKLIP